MTANTPHTEAEIEAKVASVIAGHKMAGFAVGEEDREAVRAIITGEIDVEESVARVISSFRERKAAQASTAPSSTAPSSTAQ